MSRGLRRLLLAVSLLLIVLLGVVVGDFLHENAGWVVLRFHVLRPDWEQPFLLLEYEASLALVIGVAAACGFVLALLLFLPSWLRQAVERGRERRFIDRLEGELVDLRNMPVTAPAPYEDLPGEKAPAVQPPESDTDDDVALLAAALRGEEERGQPR